MGKKKMKIFADRSYLNALEIKACEGAGIQAYLPKSTTSGAKANKRFDRSDFIYIAKDDGYRRPAGERAIHRFAREERGLALHRY